MQSCKCAKCEARPPATPCPVCCVLCRPGLRIAMHFATCLEGCQSASRAGRESYHHLAAPPLPPPAPSQAQSCLRIQTCPRPPLFASRTIWWRRRLLVLRWGRRPRLGEASGAGGSFCFSAASSANQCNCDTWRSGLSLPARFDIWQRFCTTFNPRKTSIFF